MPEHAQNVKDVVLLETERRRAVSARDAHPEYFTLRADARGEWFIHAADEVLVVALDADDTVLFALEPSPAFAEEVVILPGGMTEAGEALEETANRELQEELGVKACRLDLLGELRPWSKYLSVRSFVFVGRELVPSRLSGDEKVPVGLLRVPWRAVDSLIAEGRLRDARTIAALYLTRRALGQAYETQDCQES
jgi:ADP-ribose diphosphatase